MGALVDRVVTELQDRRDKVLSGKINCIPSPLRRFSDDFVGIEQGCFYCITGSTKSSKTQIMNYLFLYNAIIYAYKHPDQLRVRTLYYPLEETQEAITTRFMCFLLYTLSKGKIRISSEDLRSTKADKPVRQDIIDMLKTREFQDILTFFENHVTFIPDKNPTGILHQAKVYADNNGITYLKDLEIKDKNGNIIETRKVFDYYTPTDPDEYVMIIIDHISLIDTERGMDLRESINKLSEYMVMLRNRYHYIPIIVQQQSTETNNLDAFKMNKIRPTVAGLADSKYVARDCNIILGMTNPAAFDLIDYMGYNISKMRSSARFLEVVINRNGQSNGIIGLYFDGACNYFRELPPPSDVNGMNEIYNLIQTRGANNTIEIKKN